MSAIREEGADAEPIRVLFTLHHNMNALDFVGPLEVLSSALHDVKDEGELSHTLMLAQTSTLSTYTHHTTLPRHLPTSYMPFHQWTNDVNRRQSL